MLTLTEALAAERAKWQQHNADTSTRQQIGRAVLEALADRLNAEPLPGWVFVLAGQEILRPSAFTCWGGAGWRVELGR